MRTVGRHLALLCLMTSITPFVGPATASDDPVVWDPFAADLSDALRLEAPWVAVSDGAFGSALLFLHEPGAGPLAEHRRDGLFLGTGHLWCDDPWLLTRAGSDVIAEALAGAGARDGGGSLEYAAAPPDSIDPILDAHFFKGSDESYLRRLAFRTPRAPWVLRFEFDEQILHDFDTTDYTVGSTLFDDEFGDRYARRGKSRIARTALTHTADDGARLDVAYERTRKHKHELPVFDLDRQEVWGERLQAGWSVDAGGGRLRTGLALAVVDLLNHRATATADRLIEMSRQTVLAGWSDGRSSLALEAGAWRLVDTGPVDWFDLGTVGAGRQDGNLTASHIWPWRGAHLTARADAAWQRLIGMRPGAGLDLAHADGAWRVRVEHGGRAPRPDELGTPWTTASSTVVYRQAGNGDLDWERSTRAEAAITGRRLGFDLTLNASARRLRDGIGWLHDGTDTEGSGPPVLHGVSANGLELDGWTTGLALGRALRWHGDLTLRGRVDLRGWTVGSPADGPLPLHLPPELSAAAEARWVRSFFDGDGILELAWQTEHRAEMADPWLPGTADRLPASTLHHALVMFRLTGADLGVSFRNLLDARDPLRDGVAGRGREMRWRLQWVLRH